MYLSQKRYQEASTETGTLPSPNERTIELEFLVEPSQQSPPPQTNINFAQKLAMNKEMKCLLAIGCIKKVFPKYVDPPGVEHVFSAKGL